MFTDQPVTPLHLETLLSFVRLYAGKRSLTREALRDIFQPASLTQNQLQSSEALKAAMDLQLVLETDAKLISPAKELTGKLPIDELLKAAIDELVLGRTELEPFFALFYSYMLGRNRNAFGKTREDWALEFNHDVFENKEQSNQFNSTKLTGLHRWFCYVGLGWYDQTDTFNCNPFYRIARRLPLIFGRSKRLDSDAFISSLATACPELDCGRIFMQANRRYDQTAMQCSLGLSHALVDLHYSQIIILHCPKDSAGWSIALASPSSDGKTLIGDRFSQVELGKGFAR